MDLALRDKVVVVTGGASGIGAAITQACLDEGAHVAVLSRISAGVPEFVEAVRQQGHRFTFVEVELADPSSCRSALDQVQRELGDVFGLVNNAGVNDGVGLEQGSPEQFLASLRTNLLHAYTLAHYALPMLKRTRGTIVSIGSKVALTGQGNTSGYAAAKGGLLALTREWAAELLPAGIRVNCVVPAEVMTPAYSMWLAKQPNPTALLDRIQARIPLGQRMTTPEEIASTVLFLLSPTHSAHTTGQHLHVDGGYVHLDRVLTTGSSPA